MLVESERDSLDGEMIVDSVGYDSVMKYSAPTVQHSRTSSADRKHIRSAEEISVGWQTATEKYNARRLLSRS